MVKITNLTKRFGEYNANEDITLEIKKGEIFGILGPNGAGKTTLISQIMGFIQPTEGNITVNGFDSWKESFKFMDKLGFVAGEIKLYEGMKVNKFINIYKNFNNDIDDAFIDRLVQIFELDLTKKIKLLSKGNKQKVAIICAVMAKPEILILDEPTGGLDPIMQEKFNVFINELKKIGTTVVLCSHIFQEIEKLCDRVVFLKEGKVVRKIILDDNTRASLENDFNSTFGKADDQIKGILG